MERNQSMKKKIICSIIMTAILSVGLYGCGDKGSSTTTQNVNVTTETVTTEEAEGQDTENTSEASLDNTEADSGNVSDTTVGNRYLKVFEATDKTGADEVIDELLSQVQVPYQLVKMDVEEGFLSGFDEEVRGFSKGVMISPMIGTIPFVGYVFETDDPEGLLSFLKEKANMAWNICTQADETVSAIKGNLVFFMMCSNEN